MKMKPKIVSRIFAAVLITLIGLFAFLFFGDREFNCKDSSNGCWDNVNKICRYNIVPASEFCDRPAGTSR